jgi:hypothetical protein
MKSNKQRKEDREFHIFAFALLGDHYAKEAGADLAPNCGLTCG